MMINMGLSNVEDTIKVCQEHLINNKVKGTEIESFLTQFLLIYIYRSFEQEIRKMIIQRVAIAGDKDIEFFVENTIKHFGTILLSEVKGNLGKFGDVYKVAFDSKINERDESFIRFNNIVINRHLAAHGKEIKMSFDEVVDSYHKAEVILTAISEVLSTKATNSL